MRDANAAAPDIAVLPTQTPTEQGTTRTLDSAPPIDMILFCPACGLQHIDAPEPTPQFDNGMGARLGGGGPWTNPPHRSHLCRPEHGGCGHIWRPADVATNGVADLGTYSNADSPPIRYRSGARLLERLEAVFNFQAHPGNYEDAGRSEYAADAPAYRAGWGDAVHALQDRAGPHDYGDLSNWNHTSSVGKEPPAQDEAANNGSSNPSVFVPGDKKEGADGSARE